MKTLAAVGVGNMGAALVRGVIARGVVEAGGVRVVDRAAGLAERLGAELGVAVCGTIAEAVRGADAVMLAVKPQQMGATLAELGPEVGDGAVLVSVAAGVTLAQLRRGVAKGHLVRAMPNTPALVGAGASAWAVEPGAPEFVREVAGRLLSAVGLAVEVPEAHMDAVTAVSGSGPAYVFALLEALEEAAAAVGLEPGVGAALARQTVIGAGRLLEASGLSAAALRAQVTSPGGTTEAALGVMSERGLAGLVEAAVVRAKARGGELAAMLDAAMAQRRT